MVKLHLLVIINPFWLIVKLMYIIQCVSTLPLVYEIRFLLLDVLYYLYISLGINIITACYHTSYNLILDILILFKSYILLVLQNSWRLLM